MTQLAVVNVVVQSLNGLPVVQVAVPEQSVCFVTASYFDAILAPLVPSAVQYRVDDYCSGVNIIPWTAIATPAVSNQITIPSASNVFISFSRFSETHQILVQATDSEGNNLMGFAQFLLVRSLPTGYAAGDFNPVDSGVTVDL
jgi:hypothetical protein